MNKFATYAEKHPIRRGAGGQGGSKRPIPRRKVTRTLQEAVLSFRKRAKSCSICLLDMVDEIDKLRRENGASPTAMLQGLREVYGDVVGHVTVPMLTNHFKQLHHEQL